MGMGMGMGMGQGMGNNVFESGFQGANQSAPEDNDLSAPLPTNENVPSNNDKLTGGSKNYFLKKKH
jgi:membrane protease subunit (stomatin/prohibitin family)